VFDGDLGQYDAFFFFTTGNLTEAGTDNTPAMSARGRKRRSQRFGTEKDSSAFILRATHSTRRENLTRRNNSWTHISRCLEVCLLVMEANKRGA